ncbi:DUF736 domain-containing protein, partial [Salipiger bermudensis]|uniref:DUF736 domain-containing protein n=1 Tax=Salipiger bermudensis TaxID=344736 RepID=UPI003F81D9FA
MENGAHGLSRVSEPAGEKAGPVDGHPRPPSSPFLARPMSAPYGPFNGLIWPKTGCASTGLAQQRRHNFLPLDCAHSARNKKVLPVLSGPRHAGGAPPVVFGLSIAIGPQWCGPGNGKRRLKMATIGTFKKTGNEFTGEIVTLSVQVQGVRIVPDTRATGENAPSHRVLVGRAEIGAAW